ncbi:hypothetical protein KUTeg_016510 [Tegillarca granosa]|uniref:Uncharacterized protein n=1 Tax=Tegillarca granosa TaxID=220873 RepID=A0ABQ9EQX7_TEGGR|nr:hypothetical protein KUTeg_016510 [Tegillarca granosa]
MLYSSAHCFHLYLTYSAGLGRTGTFIGLDALLTSGWKTGFVDIFEYVKKMRQNRTNMVATATTSVIPSSTEPYNLGPFVVNQCGKNNISRDIIEIDIVIINKERKIEKKVKIYEVKTWKAGEHFPPNKNTMVYLAELTEQKRKHVTAGPITIMCPDGAICSGILCAFFHSIERVTIDEEIDLFQTVRQLNVRRPQFIQRLVSY